MYYTAFYILKCFETATDNVMKSFPGKFFILLYKSRNFHIGKRNWFHGEKKNFGKVRLSFKDYYYLLRKRHWKCKIAASEGILIQVQLCWCNIFFKLFFCDEIDIGVELLNEPLKRVVCICAYGSMMFLCTTNLNLQNCKLS